MGAVAVLAVLGGGYLWLRQSSLVAVKRVTVVGVSGPDSSQIRGALRAAALSMTTLDVQASRLHSAVVPYPVVKSLSVSTQFPHGMRIDVSEQVPVAVVAAGGRRTAVAGDGTLLPAADTGGSLPAISEPVAPGGSHLTGAARTEVALLAAAPYPLLARLSGVSDVPSRGFEATVRAGPEIVFGPARQLGAKWSAAIAVLASASSAGADYIDVTDPGRPAAGTGSDAVGAQTTTTGG